MSGLSFATVYAAVLHVIGMIIVAVLLITGHIEPSVGTSLLSALLGVGIGTGLAVANTPPPPPPPPPHG